MSLIQLRGGTEAEWFDANPVLAAREVGVTADTHRLKVGDGVTEWNDLPYVDSALLAHIQDAAAEAADFDEFATLILGLGS